jgi:Protein of unknown function (DUF2924)
LSSNLQGFPGLNFGSWGSRVCLLILQPGQSVNGTSGSRGELLEQETMNTTLEAQIEELRKLPAIALQAKYLELFGEESRSGNRQFLFRRVVWRLQALAEGDLSERARQRARELANDADLRVQPSRAWLPAPRVGPDRRLPASGTILRRSFKGRNLEVRILEDGFEFEGRRYQSLSAIASEVAGSRWNGFAFFALDGSAPKAGA